MADLSKIAEVKELRSWGSTSAVDTVNGYLKKGWQILTVKVIEAQYRMHEAHDKSHIHKTGETHYVLGRPRRKPAPK